jgi:hypothetical protein
MTNYGKVEHVKVIVVILFLLLSVGIVISGCGNNNDSKYAISGRITSAGSALSGVTIALSGDASRITVTDTNGNYRFSNLSEGEYTLTPSLTGYSFTPSKKTVYPNYEDVNGIDFSFSEQGRVAAANHTVALKNNGTVWTWGNNNNGQLGDGTTSNRTTPVQVSGLSDVTAIAAGDTHTVALKNNGTVWTWGNNNNGQLGDGTTTDSATPVQVQSL